MAGYEMATARKEFTGLCHPGDDAAYDWLPSRRAFGDKREPCAPRGELAFLGQEK